MSNELTVGQLRKLLDKMAVEDSVLVAVQCCAGADGHVLKAGEHTLSYGGRTETYSLDPKVEQAKVVGTVLLFRADVHYITLCEDRCPACGFHRGYHAEDCDR